MNVNAKIIRKINSSEFDNAVKEFLKEALSLENSIQYEAKPKYTSKYDSLIKKICH